MFGPPGSFSSSHVEGGGYGSLNVITNKDGEKFWLCMNFVSTQLFMEEISKLKLQTNKCPHGRNGKKCGNGRPCADACACEKSALHGPGFFVTPKFLNEHNIPYFTFVQHPGDLVFTFPGVAHQIVNTKPTVCEARNIMPLTFAYDRRIELICDCGPEVGGRVLYHLDLHAIPNIPYDAFCEGCKRVFFLQTPEQHKGVCPEVRSVDDAVLRPDVGEGTEGSFQENTCDFSLTDNANCSLISPVEKFSKAVIDESVCGANLENVSCSFVSEPEEIVVIPDISEFASTDSKISSDGTGDLLSNCCDYLDHVPVDVRDTSSVASVSRSDCVSVSSDANEKFKCAVCDEIFVRKWNLERHKKTVHSKIKPFECTYCSKTFKTKPILKQHLLFHAGASFACEVCGKTYSDLANMRRHKLVHVSKPYICDVCKKVFSRKDNLSRHKKLHEK